MFLDRPIPALIPAGKKNLGECNLQETEEYYNNGLMGEARELLEYHAYLLGKFEAAKTNRDVKTATEVSNEMTWLNERTDTVTKKMLVIKKLFEMAPNVIQRMAEKALEKKELI